MDANTLMTLMGLAGVHNAVPTSRGITSAQLDMGGATQPAPQPAVGTIPTPPAFNPLGTPIVANPWSLGSDTIGPDTNAGQGIPNLAAMKPAAKSGGFSTGNILQALLGSNFGQ